MEQKHSPLPWKVNNATYPQSTKWISDGNGKIIVCKLHEIVRTEEANAEFIVQACNNFKELLQGCKDTTYWLDFFDSDLPHNSSLAELKLILAEAITKAEGK